MHDPKDITIIGAGPTGIFGLFYAGMRGATAQVVDALNEPGGQLTALYPEKYIFDVAGFPKVLAKDLVRSMVEQARQFNQPMHLGQRITGLEEENGHFVLVTEKARFPSRAIVIAAGIGAFSPRRLPRRARSRGMVAGSTTWSPIPRHFVKGASSSSAEGTRPSIGAFSFSIERRT